jgi:hypothetical protein
MAEARGNFQSDRALHLHRVQVQLKSAVEVVNAVPQVARFFKVAGRSMFLAKAGKLV